MANLPAKRNSRQLHLQTSKQINKRSTIVPGRKTLHGSVVLPAAKLRVPDSSSESKADETQSSLKRCESMNLQPKPLNAAATIHNGNGTDNNKNLANSSASAARKVIGPQCNNTTAVRSRQNIPYSVSVARDTTLRASSSKVHKVLRQKSRPKRLGNSISDENDKLSARTIKTSRMNRNRVSRVASVMKVSKTEILRWKKNKHEIVRISTTNGHHRLLRSSGLRPLLVSLQSMRSKARKRSVLKSSTMLNRRIQASSPGMPMEELSNGNSSSTKHSTIDTVDKVLTTDVSESNSTLTTTDENSASAINKAATGTVTSDKHQDEENKITEDTPAGKQQPPFVDVLASEIANVSVVKSLQFTPDQPIRKQYDDVDTPATPTKSIRTDRVSSPISQPISPTSTPTLASHLKSGPSSGSKRKPKKLNDCIAMLTGKLSERLGVDFFKNETHRENTNPEETVNSSSLSATEIPTPNITGTTAMQTKECFTEAKGEQYNRIEKQVSTPSTSLPNVSSSSFDSSSSSLLSQSKMPSPVAICTHDFSTTGTRTDQQTSPIQLKTAVSIQSQPSHSVAPQSTFQHSALPIASADSVSDEPLNLSINSSLDSARNVKLMPKHDNGSTNHRSNVLSLHTPQQESSTMAHLPPQPLHFQHSHAHNRGSHYHQHPATNSAIVNTHSVHKLTGSTNILPDSSCTVTSKSGSGNLSSIKLPPGLIIERVEYKQSRPTFSKEAPSVTIVARHRQVPTQAALPTSVENSATDLSVESTNIPFASNSLPFAKPAHNNISNLRHHSDPNHTKIGGYVNYPDHSNPPHCSEPALEATSAMRIPSGLRSGPCAENHISVTITESKAPNLEPRMQEVIHMPKTSVALCMSSQSDKMNRSQCSVSQLKPSQLNVIHSTSPLKQSTSMQSSASMHKTPIGVVGPGLPGLAEKLSAPMTTLIIPQVPMPPMASQIIPPATKRARRKSVFVPLPVPTGDTNRDVAAKPVRQQHPTCPSIPTTHAPTITPSTGLASANLLASMSLSFVAPNLLPVTGAPMLGPIDLQRLASVTLPAHLKPPVIPPLTIPSAAAASAALLEKIFHPTRSEVLSTSLELKRDTQYNSDKQPAKEPFRNSVENSCGAPMPSIADMNKFVAPIEQQLTKPTASSILRSESINTFDATVGKINAPTGMSKGVGRIMKRRASVADYQRKALMEQIWNKSILDKIMEKHTTIVPAGGEAQNDLNIQNPSKQIVTENCNVSNKGDVCQRPVQTVEISSSVQQPIITSPKLKDDLVAHKQDSGNSDKMSSQSVQQNVDDLAQCVESTTTQGNSQDKELKSTEIASSEEPLITGTTECGKLVQDEKKQSLTYSPRERMEKIHEESLDMNPCEVSDSSKPSSVTQSIHPVNIVGEADAVQKDRNSEIVEPLAATDGQKGGSTKIVRKRRKNELASILSDQLLESFKEVDKSRLNDLKLLHDLTCETPDVKFTLEQIPQLAKRKSNPRMPKLLVQDSPKISTPTNATQKKVHSSTKKVAKESEDIAKTSALLSNESASSSHNSSGKLKANDKSYNNDPTTAGFRRMRKFSIDIENFTSLQKDDSAVKDTASGQFSAGLKTTRAKTQTTLETKIAQHSFKKTVTLLVDAQYDGGAHVKTTENNITNESENSADHLKDLPEHEQTPLDRSHCTAISDNNTIANPLCFVDMQPKEDMPTEKPIAANLPKRIMSRRKSVFVDRDLAQYITKEEKQEEKTQTQSFSTTFKDDLILTSRRGTRSQGKLGLDLVESFVEATMKPRDPRRRVLQKRREEERMAKENKELLQVPGAGALIARDVEQITDLSKNVQTVACNSLEKTEKTMKNEIACEPCESTNLDRNKAEEIQTPPPLVGLQNNIPLRRINTRRSSVCVRPMTTPQPVATSCKKNGKEETFTTEPSKEDEHLRNIGNEVKRIYRRRASIYQPPEELQDQLGNGREKGRQLRQTSNTKEVDSCEDESSNLTVRKKQHITVQKNHTGRSKTPGPSDWKRRNQLPLNGTPEPLIESLLLHASNVESNAPKRRTTKNSQIAETVSKLFNIQEEIMLIDSSRRKPRKANPPPATPLESPVIEMEKEEAPVVVANENKMKKEVENSKPLFSNGFTTVDDSMCIENTPAKPPIMARKSFSFSNDEDESPKAINKLVETIINNTVNSSSNTSTDDSDDDNMSLACFAARSNVHDNGVGTQHSELFAKPPLGTNVYSTGRAMSVIADDESTTNTDALDDDMMSVTTEIPTSLNSSASNSRHMRRKRRKSRRQCSKLKRQQAKEKEQNSKQVQTFNCDLCRKVFKKQDAYNKHRMTLSHIAKLSEQEYLIAQQKQTLMRDDEVSHAISENSQIETKLTIEASVAIPTSEEVKKKDSNVEGTTEQSSPSDRVPTTLIGGAEKNEQLDGQTVKELSQEEKLFYECCSMLKESNTNENDQLNHLAVAIKTNDMMDQGNSPDRRLMFTDDGNSLSTSISSAFIPSVEINQTLNVGAACTTREEAARTEQEQVNYQKGHEPLNACDNDTVQRCVGGSTGGNVSPQSSVQSSSTNQSYNNAKIKTKGALKGYDNFKVSIPMTGLTVMSASTTSIGIGIGIGKESRLDTLADVALCGDIPKEFGIAGQMDELNSTDIVRAPEEQRSNLYGEAKLPLIVTDSTIEHKVDVPHLATSKVPDEKSCTGEAIASKTVAKSKTHRVQYSENVGKSQKKSSSRWITGQNRRRAGKNSLLHAAGSARCGSLALDESADDVYAFQDSPCDGDLPSVYSSKKNNVCQSQNIAKSDDGANHSSKHRSTVSQSTAHVEDHDDSQMSSLSFSDRDDFVYGTNTMSEEEEEEEDKTSSISSEQTSPKKLTSADVQKKSLIMGRIFKKGGAKEKIMSDCKANKNSVAAAVSAIVDTAQVASMTAVVAKSTATKPVAKDFDKLFDTLKNAAEPVDDAMQGSDDTILLPVTPTELDKQHTDEEMRRTFCADIENKLHGCQEKKIRQQHQLCQNEFEVTSPGPARLRRRRTVVQQKNLTESWDSDEFEDFQTGDIMKLIDRAENDEMNDKVHEYSNTNTLRHISRTGARTHCEKPDNFEKVELSECKELDAISHSPILSNAISCERDQHRMNQTLEKQSLLKKETIIVDKKSSKSDVVTDDTIRKVMESVILETMGKNSNGSKRKLASYVSSGVTGTLAFPSKTVRPASRTNNNMKSCTSNSSAEDVSQALELTSLEEHTLESSVVISSKTITSKFKQKLNSSTRHAADDRKLVEVVIGVDKEKEPNSSKLKPLPEISSITKPASACANINSAILNNNNNNTNKNNNSDNRQKPATKSTKASGIGNKGTVKPKNAIEDWPGKVASLPTNKQRKVAPKKMKNVAYDPDSDYEQSIKCKKVKRKLLENDIEANLKIEQLHSTLLNSDDNNILLTTSRRKRNAGEMLYYWSSTSDEEIEKEVVVGSAKGSSTISKSVNNGTQSGKKRGRKKKQVDNTDTIALVKDKAIDGGGISLEGGDKHSSQDISALTSDKKSKTLPGVTGKKSAPTRRKQQSNQIDSDKSAPTEEQVAGEDSGTTSNEHLQQHGWIMGDSHKKLVTLLAHAKGKHDSRKATNNRRK
uniref:C2H2-type domain-containing protein n=1 Tax=Anopheles farauti TaxID=69004 RepID=A0A182Q2X0_9DIPT